MVTIGIPFYNCEKFLKDAIRSVFAQTYGEWELILVDDGSVDGSLEIARAVQDTRVRVFSDGKHLGLIERLNQIIGLSSGRYIARMDADDLMHPRRLEQQVAYLEAHPDVDVLGTGMYSLGKDNSVVGKRVVASVGGKVKGFIHVSVLAKKEWFCANNYDPQFVRAEDQELWLRTYKGSNFANLAEQLMFVREMDSVNFNKYSQSCRTMRKIFAKYALLEFGRTGAIFLIGQSYLKELLYAVSGLTGWQMLLVRGRSMPLENDEKISAKAALEKIIATRVKGLDHEAKHSN